MNKIGIFLLLIVSISFSNCAFDFTEEDRQAVQDKLVGTWELVNTTPYISEFLENKPTIEFKSTGTFDYLENGNVIYEEEYFFDYRTITFRYYGEFLKLTDSEMVVFDEQYNIIYSYEKVN
jgi:hypothetical protein